ELNPAFNLPVFAYKAGRQMLLPASKVDKFQANLDKWSKPLLTWEVYMPKSDESVGAVASDHGMSAGQLLAANRISGGTLKAGQPVLVAMNKPLNDGQSFESVDTLIGDAPASAGVTMIAQAAPAQTATPTAEARTAAALVAIAAEDSAAARSLATRDLGNNTVASDDVLYSISRHFGVTYNNIQRIKRSAGIQSNEGFLRAARHRQRHPGRLFDLVEARHQEALQLANGVAHKRLSLLVAEALQIGGDLDHDEDWTALTPVGIPAL
ncbi:LysM peptidoglycan-binding domain-containing protein, partial [Chromobacterium violaceum]